MDFFFSTNNKTPNTLVDFIETRDIVNIWMSNNAFNNNCHVKLACVQRSQNAFMRGLNGKCPNFIARQKEGQIDK